MTIKNIPAAPTVQPRAGVRCDLSPVAMERWKPGLMASETDEASTIAIMDPIGYDFWGDGVTAKRVEQRLKAIGSGNDVEVIINSPGGDVFEGLAIYNLLRQHKGRVTTKVVGLAASAASFIFMAGDQREIARAAFLMVHNSWVCACGNRHDLREIADWLEPFDGTLADIYAARSGVDIERVREALDEETWIGGREAVDEGWADALFAADEVEDTGARNLTPTQIAARRVDALLARQGVSRSERRALIQDLKSSMPSATASGKHDATGDPVDAEAVAQMHALLRRLTTNETV